MLNAKILIIEDDPAIAEIVAYNLTQAGCEVVTARDGRKGLERAFQSVPDLVVLDLMLPSLDGIEICRRLRADARTKDVLILILTAKAEESDQVIGFAVNADDYVTKPFSVKVLTERVRSLLRRRDQASIPQDVTSHGGVTVDRVRHIASTTDGILDLTPTEFALLDSLMRQPGRAYRRGDLIDSAMGEDTIVLDRTIDVHIRSLRKKLGRFADVIETVRGIGYRFRDSQSTI
jgi:two-component system phosphate regulon response regulator PhoB